MTGVTKASKTTRRGQPWDNRRKRNATDYVAERINDLQTECKETDAHIARAQELMSVRLSSDNKTGTVLSMRRVLQFEALKKANTKAIAELRHLILELWATDLPFDYAGRVETIVSKSRASSREALIDLSSGSSSQCALLEEAQERCLNQTTTHAA